MKTKSTVIWLGLALAAAGFFHFFEARHLSTRERALRREYLCLFDQANVEGISLSNNEEQIELRRGAGGGWELTAPVHDRADAAAVEELLGVCASLRADAVLEGKDADKKRMRDYGVYQSRLGLKLLGRDMPPAIWFGKETAVEGKAYVRLAGAKEVLVTSAVLRGWLTRKAEEFRDRRLTAEDAAHTTRFSLKTAAGEIELAKAADHWTLSKPLKARADDFRTAELIDTLLGMRIAGFLSDKGANLNRYGLGEPRATVTFATLRQEQPLVLELGAVDEKSGQVFARLSSREGVYLLPKEVERLVTLLPNEFRDRHLLRVDWDAVDRLTLETASGEKRVLQRQPGGWARRDGAAAQPVEGVAMETLMGALNARELKAWVADGGGGVGPLSRYGLDHPAMRLVFASYASGNTAESNAGEHPFLTLELGREEAGVVYARVVEDPSMEPAIVTVDRALLDALNPGGAPWR
jgi:hypothetical protein